MTDGQRTDDTFFLLSFDEVGFNGQENALSIFKKDSRQRVAEACDSLPWFWWIRSPYAEHRSSTRCVCTQMARRATTPPTTAPAGATCVRYILLYTGKGEKERWL